LFVIEQPGRIRILQNGQLTQTPLLDISARVGSRGNEQGLLGLALHPNFPRVGYFYVNYTDLKGDTVIARFQVSKSDPNLADPASETALLRVDQPFANHNGGSVVFGPDGRLYLGLGDGGSQGDPNNNAQNPAALLGKILRLDVGSNGDQTPRPEVYALGLRNPWRFSFDRRTGEMYIGDVGQNQIEEIDYLPAGAPPGTNFGWRFFEGDQPYRGTPPAGVKFTGPVAEYSHSLGCSVTGGYIYRGAALPAWDGVYLYGDFCSGTVWGLRRDAAGAWSSAALFQSVAQLTSFGQDEVGEVYICDRSGRILKLSPRS
jgi:glucose/arabinose dehydrogenase